MPRPYSSDPQYNKELEDILSRDEYVQSVIDKYKEYEEKYILPRVEDIESIGRCSVPQEPYEGKADEMVCAPEPETKYENDGRLDEEVAAMLAEDEKTMDEITDCVMGDGEYSMASIAAKIKEKSDRLSELKLMKDKFDEYYNNARFYEYYLSVKKNKKLVASAEKPEVVYLVAVAELAIYSTSATFIYNPLTNRILKYEVFMTDYSDLKQYKRIGTSSNLRIFGTSSRIKLNNAGKANNRGKLYSGYYDEISNPVDNLFTLSERGVSKRNNRNGSYNAATMDSKGNPISYIEDEEKYKNFYLTMDKKLPAKKKASYDKHCGGIVDKIEKAIRELVESEGLFGINDDELETLRYFDEFHDEYRKLEKEIARLEDELSPDSIRKMMKNNPCFAPEDTPDAPAVVEDMLGGFSKVGGRDMNNPTMEQTCYWVKFCTLATIYGLLPFPEPVNQMRYWGIGLKVATPAGIFNVPMPTIWIPIMTASSKFGVFVLMIGQIGIIPHPFVLWINRAGVARFVVTMMGANLDGEIIGYDPNQEAKFLLDKGIRIPRLNLGDLTKGVFNVEKFLDVDKGVDLDSDLIDIGELNDISMESTMMELNKLMYAFDEKKEQIKEQIPRASELKKIAEELHSEIDKIDTSLIDDSGKLQEYMEKYTLTIDEYRQMAEEIVNSINLPEIPLLDELDIYKLLDIPSPTADIDEMIKTLSSVPFPNVNLGDLKQVKQFVLNRIMMAASSGKIQQYIMDNIPEELDLELEEDFIKVRDFIAEMCDDIIDNINPMIIHLPTYLDEYLGAGLDFSLSLGFACGGKPVPLHLEVDPQTISMLKLVQSFIETPWHDLTYDDVKQYIADRYLSRNQIVDFSKYIIEEVMPDFDFPFDLNINPYEIALKIIKVMKMFSDPKMAIEPFYKKLVSSVQIAYVKLDMFKAEILKFVNMLAEKGLVPLSYISGEDLRMYLHGIVSMVFEQKAPMFLYKKVAQVFGIVDGAEDYVMKMAKEIMPKLFGVIEDIKKAIETVNKMAKVIKVIKNSNISMNSLDNAFSPKAFLDNVADTIKCATVGGDDCLPKNYLCDIVLAKKALELMEKYNLLKFPVVGAMCWADRVGARKLIRNAHPLMHVEDFPPYERMTLNNPLFCLFLDDFCHQSKKYALFGERFGY